MTEYNLTVEMNLQKPNAANLARVRQSLENSLGDIDIRITPGAAAKTRSEIQAVDKAIRSTNNSAKELTVNLGSFQELLSRTIMITALNKVVGAISNANREALRYESELAKLAQVTRKTNSEIKENSEELIKISRFYNIASSKVAQLTRTLSQTGLSLREAAKGAEILAKTSLLATFDSLSSTTEGFIAIMNTFQFTVKETGDALEAINAISKRYAVESSDLVAAVVRTGGVFSTAGGQINELLAAITTVRSTTRESSETISTGFRTIFGRLQRPKTIQYFRDLGIELERGGKFIGPWEAIIKIGKDLESLNITPGDLRFAEVVEQIGGIRQLSKVVPLLTRTATLEKALADANDAEKESVIDLAKAQETLSFKLGQLQKNFSSLINEMVASNEFQFVANSLIQISSAVLEVTRALTAMKPLMPILGLGVARGAFQFFSGGGGRGLRSLVGLNSGGLVPGTGDSDSVPAMLTPGEFVIRKRAVKAIGIENLSKINKYNSGGLINEAKNREPALLTPGEFVINKRSARAYGYSRLNEINKYAQGGVVAVERFSKGGEKKRRKQFVELPPSTTWAGRERIDIGPIPGEGLYGEVMSSLGEMFPQPLRPKGSKGPNRPMLKPTTAELAQDYVNNIEKQYRSVNYHELARSQGGLTADQHKRFASADPEGFSTYVNTSKEADWNYGPGKTKEKPTKKRMGGDRDYMAAAFVTSTLLSLGKQYDENGKALDTFSNSIIDASSQASLFLGVLSSAGIDFKGVLSNTFGRIKGGSRGVLSKPGGGASAIAGSLLAAAASAALIGTTFKEIRKQVYDVAEAEKLRQKAIESGNEKIALSAVDNIVASRQFGSPAMNASITGGVFGGALAGVAIAGPIGAAVGAFVGGLASASDAISVWASDSDRTLKKQTVAGVAVASTNLAIARSNRQRQDLEKQGNTAQIEKNSIDIITAQKKAVFAVSELESQVKKQEGSTLNTFTMGFLGGATEEEKRELNELKKATQDSASAFKQIEDDIISQISTIQSQTGAVQNWSDVLNSGGPVLAEYIKYLEESDPRVAKEFKDSLLSAAKTANVERTARIKAFNGFRAEQNIIRARSIIQSRLNDSMMMVIQSSDRLNESFSLMNKVVDFTARSSFSGDRASSISDITQIDNPANMTRVLSMVDRLSNRTPGVGAAVSEVQRASAVQNQISGVGGVADQIVRTMNQNIEIDEGELQAEVDDAAKRIASFASKTEIENFKVRYSKLLKETGGATSQSDVQSLLEDLFVRPFQSIADKVADTYQRQIQALNRFSEGLRSVSDLVDQISTKRIEAFSSDADFRKSLGKIATGGTASPIQGRIEDIQRQKISLSSVGLGGLAGNTTGIGQTIRKLQAEIDKQNTTWEKFGATTKEDILLQEQRQRKIDLLNRALDSQIQSFGKLKEAALEVAATEKEIAKRRQEELLGDIGKNPETLFKESQARVLTGRVLSGNLDIRQLSSQFAMARGNMFGPEIFRQVTEMQRLVLSQISQISEGTTPDSKKAADLLVAIADQESELRGRRDIALGGDKLRIQARRFEDLNIAKLGNTSRGLAALGIARRANRAEQDARGQEILNLGDQSAILVDHFKDMSVEVELLTGLYGKMSGVLQGPMSPAVQQQQQQQRSSRQQSVPGQSMRQRTEESKKSFKVANQKNTEGLNKKQRESLQAQFGIIAPQEFARQTAYSQERSRSLGLIEMRRRQRENNVLPSFGHHNTSDNSRTNLALRDSIYRGVTNGYITANQRSIKEREMLDRYGTQGLIRYIHGQGQTLNIDRAITQSSTLNQPIPTPLRDLTQKPAGFSSGGGMSLDSKTTMQSRFGARTASGSMNTISGAFNADQLKMIQSALAPFVNAVQMLKQMPTSIDVAVNDVSVSVHHNGLEVFSKIKEEVERLISQKTALALLEYDRNIHSGTALS